LHGVDEALAALAIAQTHFARVSIDLIYSPPSQSMADWEAELTRALSFGTDHLSLYQLTIEAGTRFATLVREGAFAPLADDPAADLFTLTRAITAAHGMPAYEVSNHARMGQESRHNLTYWRYHDYAGIGPGAHGRRGGVATTRHKKPENWLSAVTIQGDGIAEARALSASEQAAESMLMGLRLAEGVDVAALAARFGFAEADLVDPAKAALYAQQGLMRQAEGRVIVSEPGMLVLNSLIAELVPAALVA
jgi:oxygen-independent coproporphyrinogen-3 oxidase